MPKPLGSTQESALRHPRGAAMGNTDPNALALGYPGLTKREWFAGQFAASGAYTPAECVARADELIERLNGVPNA